MSDEDPDAETGFDDGPADGDGGRTESDGADGESRAGPETAADVQDVLDRITEYDDELARDVRSIVETARNLNATVDDQRDELADLEERVEEQAETIERLQERLEDRESAIEDREETIDDLESRVKRTQADFQNYKKRAKKRQEQIKRRATEDLVERLVAVRDDLKRALEEESDDVESLREGVEMIRREFDRVLGEEGVEEIDPEPGSEVDPTRHEVMARIDSDRPEGTIAGVYAVGYEMEDSVVRAAQVTVSDGGADPAAESEEGDDADAESEAGDDGEPGSDAESADASEAGSMDASEAEPSGADGEPESTDAPDEPRSTDASGDEPGSEGGD